MYPNIRLKRHEDKRLKHGHLWIYSNEIDVQLTPLKAIQPGQIVALESSQGQSLGLAYINPHTLLCGRLLTRDCQHPFDQATIEKRLQRALALRTALYKKPFYRLVYGESDWLPGLIVDRYDDLLVVQITTAGIEALKDTVINALCAVIHPKAILLRNDHSMRATENLPSYVEAAYGTPAQRIELEENGVRFCVSPWEGQKTGWFYDHRDNRAQLARYVAGKRVLDLFCYVGGWAIQAAAFGAKEVVAIDSSATALEQLTHNAKLNGVANQVSCLRGDVFELLKQLQEKNERFDVVLLDPPAFIKKRKDVKAGSMAYQRVNEWAMRLLADDGILVSSSCSQHFSKEELTHALLEASLKSGRNLQILAQGHQAADHPVHPAISETDYLKSLFCGVGFN